MQPVAVGLGLALLASSGFLAAVGGYDGVLGATNPDLLLGPRPPEAVTLRIVVAGTTAEAAAELANLETGLSWHGLPGGQGPSYIRVTFIDAPAGAVKAYLRPLGDAPPLGTRLVAEAHVRAYWPLSESGRSVGPQPYLFLEPTAYHEPFWFKS